MLPPYGLVENHYLWDYLTNFWAMSNSASTCLSERGRITNNYDIIHTTLKNYFVLCAASDSLESISSHAGNSSWSKSVCFDKSTKWNSQLIEQLKILQDLPHATFIEVETEVTEIVKVKVENWSLLWTNLIQTDIMMGFYHSNEGGSLFFYRKDVKHMAQI